MNGRGGFYFKFLTQQDIGLIRQTLEANGFSELPQNEKTGLSWLLCWTSSTLKAKSFKSITRF